MLSSIYGNRVPRLFFRERNLSLLFKCFSSTAEPSKEQKIKEFRPYAEQYLLHNTPALKEEAQRIFGKVKLQIEDAYNKAPTSFKKSMSLAFSNLSVQEFRGIKDLNKEKWPLNEELFFKVQTLSESAGQYKGARFNHTEMKLLTSVLEDSHLSLIANKLVKQKNPTLFISHAHPILEIFPFEYWTEPFLIQFAYDLAAMGIDVKLDYLHSRFGCNMQQFMMDSVLSDLIFPIGTRSFPVKINDDTYQASMIRTEFPAIKDRIERASQDAVPSGVAPLQLTGRVIDDVFIPPYKAHFASESFQGNAGYFLTLLDLAAKICIYFQKSFTNSLDITSLMTDPNFWHPALIKDISRQYSGEKNNILFSSSYQHSEGMTAHLWAEEKSHRAKTADYNLVVMKKLLADRERDGLPAISAETLQENISEIKQGSSSLSNEPEKSKLLVLASDTATREKEDLCRKLGEHDDLEIMAQPTWEHVQKFRESMLSADYVIVLIDQYFMIDFNYMKHFSYFMHNCRYHQQNFRPIILGQHLKRDDYLAHWDEQILETKRRIREVKNTHPINVKRLELLQEDYRDQENIRRAIDIFIILERLTINIPRYMAIMKSPNMVETLNLLSKEVLLGKNRRRKKELERKYQALLSIPTKNAHEPEFPPENPQYPATQTFSILLPNGKQVLIKDESTNLTGTHKDRMAWEVVQFYKRYVQTYDHAPPCSIITSGCAGIAIQTKLRAYNLPDLRVLVDHSVKDSIKEDLIKAGCQIYSENLAAQQLSPQDVLNLTKNSDGIELTYRHFIDPGFKLYYDWLSFEILNSDADHFFIPFGSGDLFHNLLSICAEIYYQGTNDPRLKRKNIPLNELRFFGATTSKPYSIMDKLYAPYKPSMEAINATFKGIKEAHICHPASKIENVEEQWAIQALQWANGLNICTEPSGIAGLALYLQIQKQLPADAKVCIINTGKLKMPSFFSNRVQPKHPPLEQPIAIDENKLDAGFRT